MSWIEDEMCAEVVKYNKKHYSNWISNAESNVIEKYDSNNNGELNGCSCSQIK